eukprot:Sdes_comp20438_c0_seq2m14597
MANFSGIIAQVLGKRRQQNGAEAEGIFARELDQIVEDAERPLVVGISAGWLQHLHENGQNELEEGDQAGAVCFEEGVDQIGNQSEDIFVHNIAALQMHFALLVIVLGKSLLQSVFTPFKAAVQLGLDGLGQACQQLVGHAISAGNIHAMLNRLQKRSETLDIRLRVQRIDEILHNEAKHGGDILRGRSCCNGGMQKGGERGRSSDANAVVEVEAEKGNHDFDDGLHVGSKAFFELAHVADEHLAGGGFFLQRGGFDADFAVLNHHKFPALIKGGLARERVVLVHHHHVSLQLGRLQQRGHHNRQIRDKVLAENLADARPRGQHVRGLGIVVVEGAHLNLRENLHDCGRILHKVLLADSKPDQTGTLDRFAAQEAL